MNQYQKRKLKDFLDNNREALEIMSNLIEEEKKIKVGDTNDSVSVRLKAIDLVERWMSECFGVAYSVDLVTPEVEDNLYRRLNKEHQ